MEVDVCEAVLCQDRARWRSVVSPFLWDKSKFYVMFMLCYRDATYHYALASLIFRYALIHAPLWVCLRCYQQAFFSWSAGPSCESSLKSPLMGSRLNKPIIRCKRTSQSQFPCCGINTKPRIVRKQ